MLGKDRYIIQGVEDLSSDEWRCLFLLYSSLISHNGVVLYGHLLNTREKVATISELLAKLSFSLESFSLALEHLNEYGLVETYRHRKEEQYLLIVKAPKSVRAFLKDDIFSRLLCDAVGREAYASLYTSLMIAEEEKKDYENETKHLKIANLASCIRSYEMNFDIKKAEDPLEGIHSFFDLKRFLKEASLTLFPAKFRTRENLKLIGQLADTFHVTQDQMRVYLQKTIRAGSDELDTRYLKYLCSHAIPSYQKIQKGKYDVPCILFLMNLQNGKEVSPFDKKVIDSLVNKYHLPPDVVNVLLEFTLESCENHLYTNYIYPIASDFHRNGIQDVDHAKQRLGERKFQKTTTATHPKDILPNYDDSMNIHFDEKEIEERLASLKGQK